MIYSLFDKNRSGGRSRNRIIYDTIVECLSELLLAYKDCSFSLGIPRRKLYVILQTISELLLQDKIPRRILVMVRDFTKNISQSDKTNNNRGFLKVLFHSKGMDMVNLS